jgi:muramoyltetrapeptide carboxypeptidase LdcA involved in peptidoglycan recycling
MAKIKPHQLKKGDTIGIVSPSWGGAGRFPHRVEQGIKQLQQLGFQVRIGRHALNKGDYVSDSAKNRADDLHELFTDPQVKAIIAAIGGDHSCHLLPHLDFDLIQHNPKIFMGYSDITVLNVAIWAKSRLVTFNGPALLTDFAEQPHMLNYTQEYFQKTLCSPTAVGQIHPAPAWTEEFQDWAEQRDLERPRVMQPSPGWNWLKPGKAQGRLVGGCLESLDHLRSTAYWPDWRGAIFFFETSEEAPPPERVDSLLMDYENMGILPQITGMIVGRPMRYTLEQKECLNQVLLERTRYYDFPIIAGMDFGHTAPQFLLPIGCQAEIDTKAKRFGILERAVT